MDEATGLKAVELLLLPGLDGTGLLFERLIEALDGRLPCRVISYPPVQALGYDELAAYVAERIGPRPVVVLGESFSGPVAIEVARRTPERVLGLILAGTFTRRPVPAALLRAVSRVKPQRFSRRLIDRILMGRFGDAALRDRLHGILALLNHDVLAHRLREIAVVDERDALASLECPILVLHGDRDCLVPRSPIWTALSLRPNATLRMLPGPHMVLQTNAASAAKEIEDFVNRIERTA